MHTDTSGPALALPHRYATRPKALLLLLVLMTLVSNAHLHGGDWPTHRADLRRSGISDEAIDTRTLV